MQQYSCPHCASVFLFDYPADGRPTATTQCPTCNQLVTVAAPPPPEPPPPVMDLASGARSNTLVKPADSVMRRRKRGRNDWVGWLLLGAVLLGLGGSVYFRFHQTKTAESKNAQNNLGPNISAQTKSRIEPPPATDGGETPHSSTEEGWIDATKRAVRLGDFEIRVVRAELGPALGRDANHAVVTLEDVALQITIEIKSVLPTPHEYLSWYSAAASEEEPPIELTDSAGVAYPVIVFDEGTTIRGHIPRKTLSRGDEVDDVLIFAVPEEADPPQVTYLHLRLDAARNGGQGSLQFEIPVSMIDNWE